jgi:hypothetical protein
MWSSSRTKALIRARLAALEAFGGVPLVTVCDNPKTVVLTRKGELIVWNPVSGQVALDYRFAPELCWPRAGQQKGAVENLVGWAQGSFFRCRRFHDRADLEAQLTQWLTAVNTERPSRATGEIPAGRLVQERGRLRPLPIAPAATTVSLNALGADGHTSSKASLGRAPPRGGVHRGDRFQHAPVRTHWERPAARNAYVAMPREA